MELGISTLLWYDEDDLIPQLSILAEEGIRHIELRRLPEHFDYDDDAAVRRLAIALADHGVTADTVHAPVECIIAMSGLDEKARLEAVDEVKRVAETLKRIGGGILVSHCGGMLSNEAERPLQFAAGQRSLTEVAAFCRDIGLLVAVENSLPTKLRVGDTVAEVVEFVEGIGAKNMGYCLDTSHANIGEDAVAAVGLVGHKLMALHISDNEGMSDQHALPFEGTVDWEAFMPALESVGYDGIFLLEVRGTDEPRLMLRQAKARFETLRKMYHGG
jgi:sugar phosphate isomerase/epimerase